MFNLLQAPPSPFAGLNHPVALMLICVATGLLIAIGILAYTVIGAMDIYRERMKKAPMILLLMAAGSLFAQQARAQEAEEAVQAVKTNIVSGMADSSFYLLMSVIALELLVIMMLLYALRVLTGIQRKRKPRAVTAKKSINWLEKLNKTKSVDEQSEADVDMGHDYDGIRELNNPTPPWWRWGFYASMAFAVIYIWRFHISQTAPLQLEELAIAQEKAAEAKKAYLANAANNIDENNVKLLTEAGDIEDGKKLFVNNCAACHGAEGQGVVGPNLTDDFWVHGGAVKDIFSTIKYGVPEKGMKSWKEDFSPKQLAQLTSFIKTIHGTNPPNPKAKEGTQYTGE
jgi:cytochrome c oxidase cbb3-type subunit 3